MDINIEIELKRDSTNSYPGKVKINNASDGRVRLALINPDRIIILDGKELTQAISIVIGENL
jgi:hypothetical protein